MERTGQVRTGWDSLDKVKTDGDRSGQILTGQGRSGQVRIGQNNSGQAKTVMIGLQRSGKVMINKVMPVLTGHEVLP